MEGVEEPDDDGDGLQRVERVFKEVFKDLSGQSADLKCALRVFEAR